MMKVLSNKRILKQIIQKNSLIEVDFLFSKVHTQKLLFSTAELLLYSWVLQKILWNRHLHHPFKKIIQFFNATSAAVAVSKMAVVISIFYNDLAHTYTSFLAVAQVNLHTFSEYKLVGIQWILEKEQKGRKRLQRMMNTHKKFTCKGCQKFLHIPFFLAYWNRFLIILVGQNLWWVSK